MRAVFLTINAMGTQVHGERICLLGLGMAGAESVYMYIQCTFLSCSQDGQSNAKNKVQIRHSNRRTKTKIFQKPELAFVHA